jgi:hypothetical protein
LNSFIFLPSNRTHGRSLVVPLPKIAKHQIYLPHNIPRLKISMHAALIYIIGFVHRKSTFFFLVTAQVLGIFLRMIWSKEKGLYKILVPLKNFIPSSYINNIQCIGTPDFRRQIMSHPISEDKPNTNHIRARIRITYTTITQITYQCTMLE